MGCSSFRKSQGAATGVGAPNSIDEGRPLGSDLNAMNLTITRRPAAP